MNLPFGILNVNKPSGWTSRDVVNRVQRLVPRQTRVGHAGTLDPLATGVLAVCVGPATRLTIYVQQMPKSYRATFLLGQSSPTDDTEVEATPLPNAPMPTRDAIESALPRFLGQIDQRPPKYSAIKIKGRRSYELARRGEAFELPARPVTIYSLAVVRYAYPELELDIQCGSGTYVRSLGRDLAESLGTAAVMSALVRTAIGKFHVEQAVQLDTLTADNWAKHLLPPTEALDTLPHLVLDAEEIKDVQHGRNIANRKLQPAAIHDDDPSGHIAALDEAGNLVAILVPRNDDLLRPLRNFSVNP